MPAKKTNNYSKLSNDLDDIISKLQEGNLDIDEATKTYEIGMELIRKLEQHLKTVQNKVTKIKSNFDK